MEEKPVRAASLLSLIEAELPAQPCWIDPILPKQGTLLFGGEGKIGKSFILLELARALATGTSPFGYERMKVGAPAKILLIEQELGEYGLQKRVKRSFRDVDKSVYGDRIFYASKVPEMQLDSEIGRDILFSLVDQVRPNVLMLDPIGRMNSYDENKSDQINLLFNTLEKLIKIFKEQDMSIVFSHHFHKPSTDPRSVRDPLDAYNFRGSTRWKDNPDSLITVQKLTRMKKKTHKAWNVQVRFETRQDEGLNDVMMTVNKENDLRVLFEKELLVDADDGPVVKPVKPKLPLMPREQMRFAVG